MLGFRFNGFFYAPFFCIYLFTFQMYGVFLHYAIFLGRISPLFLLNNVTCLIMSTVKDRLTSFISANGYNVAEFERTIGVSAGYVKNISKSIQPDILTRITDIYPQLNIDWLMVGRGDMIATDIIENKNGNKFAKLPNGEYLMSMPCVEVEAQAGFLDNYSDVEYLSEIPQYGMIVDKVYHGRYVAFKVEGESMDDGTSRSIPKGCRIATRELSRDNWTNKLRYKYFPYWVIYTKRNGKPLVKEIISHDVENGKIVCHSLNDSPEYADFELSLDEVNALFYVVDINRRVSSKEY